jgi:uncharacterized protein (DUF488 family)
MIAPHIRLFPHSKEEFPSLDLLTTWLLTALKARGGRYLWIPKNLGGRRDRRQKGW